MRLSWIVAPSGFRSSEDPERRRSTIITVLRHPSTAGRALRDSLVRLNPVTLLRNPVLFTVASAATLVSVVFLHDLWISASASATDVQLACWLWATVWFATFAETYAEARGKALSDALRKADSRAKCLRGRKVEVVPASKLRVGDIILAEAGDLIPVSGDILEGIATVDESMITGESAPVIRESGSNLSEVTRGTRVLSDQLKIRVTAETPETFLDKMADFMEGLGRKRLDSEVHWIGTLSLISFAVFGLLTLGYTMARFASHFEGHRNTALPPVTLFAGLVVCLMPTLIAALLPAIAIGVFERLMRQQVLATSARGIDSCSRVDTVLLDKTGTITTGEREAVEFIPSPGVSACELSNAAFLASYSDDTHEGKSIVAFASKMAVSEQLTPDLEPIPFSAYTRMSGVNAGERRVRKGATSAIAAYVQAAGGTLPPDYQAVADRIARTGGTPLGVADGTRILGVLNLKDRVKPDLAERFARLHNIGVRSVLITGDNPITAAAIAAEVGIDDVLPQSTPADKLAFIKARQSIGHVVAMSGDGSNDAPALAQADVGFVMNTGTPAAKEAGNLIDLESNPAKLVDVIAIGKQLYLTRAAIAAFSFASSLGQCVAVLPVLFPWFVALRRINVLGLEDPRSAVLAAVIWNALSILVLLRLAWRGVNLRQSPLRNLVWQYGLIYAFVGFLLSFPTIWALSRVLEILHLT